MAVEKISVTTDLNAAQLTKDLDDMSEIMKNVTTGYEKVIYKEAFCTIFFKTFIMFS